MRGPFATFSTQLSLFREVAAVEDLGDGLS